MLGLRPPGLEFRILCLENSVISIISPSSGGSQFSLCVHKGGLKPDSFHFSFGLYLTQRQKKKNVMLNNIKLDTYIELLAVVFGR